MGFMHASGVPDAARLGLLALIKSSRLRYALLHETKVRDEHPVCVERSNNARAGYKGESYFRLHSPTLLIEHAPQGNQGQIWRLSWNADMLL
jgi:hypothetical protein